MRGDDLFIGDRVRLTALEPADLDTFSRWYQHAEFMRRMNASPAYPRSKAHWERWLRDSNEDKNAYLFAIRPVDDERLLGWMELDAILWTHRTAWVAIGIGDAADRGQGYGAEAMTLLLNFAFGELNLFRVQLTVFAYNTSAIGLYERLGFVHEGTYRQFLVRDGQRHDMLLYGLLSEEWDQHQQGASTTD